jgi:hypothetical protein
MAASVTPCRHDAGATVLDKHRHPPACGSAAGLGGDVGGTDQIPVPMEAAGRTGEPAASGLGDSPTAGGAGGGGAPLVHQPHDDACLLGLVPQRLHKVGAAPLPQSEILHPAGILLADALGVAHDEGADPLLGGEGDHLLGGLMVSLMDATAMARLHPSQARPVAPPPPRPVLPRPGRSRCGLGLACLLVLQVQVVLGAQRPPRTPTTPPARSPPHPGG